MTVLSIFKSLDLEELGNMKTWSGAYAQRDMGQMADSTQFGWWADGEGAGSVTTTFAQRLVFLFCFRGLLY